MLFFNLNALKSTFSFLMVYYMFILLLNAMKYSHLNNTLSFKPFYLQSHFIYHRSWRKCQRLLGFSKACTSISSQIEKENC